MNHELIMLREVKRMQKLTQSLTKEARYRAVKSHVSYNVTGGTIGQIKEICRLIRLRDECLLFCLAVKDALSAIDSDKSLLLKEYYLKRIKIGVIADRLKVSRSKVYGGLHLARMQFRNALIKSGYDEQWFKSNFSHIDFISDRLKSA